MLSGTINVSGPNHDACARNRFSTIDDTRTIQIGNPSGVHMEWGRAFFISCRSPATIPPKTEEQSRRLRHSEVDVIVIGLTLELVRFCRTQFYVIILLFQSSTIRTEAYERRHVRSIVPRRAIICPAIPVCDRNETDQMAFQIRIPAATR